MPLDEGIHPLTRDERRFLAERLAAARRRLRAFYVAAALWVVLFAALVLALVFVARREAGTTRELLVALGVAAGLAAAAGFVVRELRDAELVYKARGLRRDLIERKKHVVWGTVQDHQAVESTRIIVVGETSIEVPDADFAALQVGDHIEVHRAVHSGAVLFIGPR